MERLRRTADSYLQDSRLSGRELNPVPPVYVLGMPRLFDRTEMFNREWLKKKTGDRAVLRVLKRL